VGAQMTIVRRALGQLDGVSGAAGAFAQGPCALTSVRLYAVDAGGSAIATGALAADGSFAELPVGTGTSSYPRVWAAAVDKCGVEGARAEALNGRDLAPPAL